MGKHQTVLDRIRKAGCRVTPTRRAILKVFEHEHEHLTPEDVLRRARRFHPALGRATVYRTLELLTGLGVMRPLYLGDGRPSFTRIEHGHHHLVCSQCDTVIECKNVRLSGLVRKLSRETGFQINSELLEFYGLCRKCRI
jgi:Fur family ferric uptake transcriptional regulator